MESFISDLGSVLYTAELDQAVYTFHASFSDYLFKKDRAKRFYCDREQHHTVLIQECFNIMNRSLKFNIVNLPSSFLADQEVTHIEKLINDKVDESLIYACENWGYHFTKSTSDIGVTTLLKQFLGEKAIYWVEVMSLLRVVKVHEGITNNTLAQCTKILRSVQKVLPLSD